jgi:hypothetical protein
MTLHLDGVSVLIRDFDRASPILHRQLLTFRGFKHNLLRAILVVHCDLEATAAANYLSVFDGIFSSLRVVAGNNAADT